MSTIEQKPCFKIGKEKKAAVNETRLKNSARDPNKRTL
uniref:Uncharacterized protein n=1 Tax=Rhizophora mucronata TaxID=61149 RepID=A0A2P2P907_RHIMU